ncbi:MAG: tetratricopeptide repeat protein [Anaerolineaceae bacterium]|nr:tetratricopeptide repeat protein [Anaerolineaceae bacterium]
MMKRFFSLNWLLLVALVLLAGCNLSDNNVTYVIVTSDAVTAAPTALPTLPPTATIPPTPTIPPEVSLQIADRYLVNGYFENAVGAYQTLLEQPGVPADVSATAAFNLGRSALREGLFDNAVTALTDFVTRYPQDSRAAQAYFLRGDAYLGLSRWAEALADFQYYLSVRPGLIDSYAYERMGDAQLALGQTETALANYAQAANASRSLVPLLALREKLAQIYLNAGMPAEALAQYDAILAVAQNAPYRASIEFLAAQTLLNSGQTEAGLQRMETILNTYTGTSSAYQAMNVLLANGYDLDGYLVGKTSYDYGDYQGAIAAFNTYSTEHLLASIPAELYLLLGRAYREIGNSAAAVTAFQTVVAQYPNDPAFGEALLEQGRTKFLAGDIPGAIQTYLSIADTYNYLPESAEALWRAGYLYGTNDEPGLSRQIFERLADAYPDTEQARSGLFLAASAAYNLGDLTGAERLFARLAVTTTGDDQSAAYLWVGRIALGENKPETAQEALQLAVTSSPDSYFSARAQDIMTGRDAFARPQAYDFAGDDAPLIAEAENWLRQTFGVTQTGDLWPLSPTVQADSRLIQGTELLAVAAYDEAENEFSDLMDTYQTDGLVSYQLAIYFRGIGAYQASVFAAANVIRAANVGTLDAPKYIARMRYPIYYLDPVLESSQRYDLDPLLLFSLIRHESLFDTYATAAAGEKGLTQVIPSTAEYIAGQLGWPNYQHSDLFRPYIGIEFGAYFLGEQLARFDGNVQAALAGYNAGPGRAANWLALSGGDPDLFMTTITIDSTRGYVQRIYGFYAIYRALYGIG